MWKSELAKINSLKVQENKLILSITLGILKYS